MKIPDLILLARSTGQPIAKLVGIETVCERVQESVSLGAPSLRVYLLHCLELSDYLDDYVIG